MAILFSAGRKFSLKIPEKHYICMIDAIGIGQYQRL